MDPGNLQIVMVDTQQPAVENGERILFFVQHRGELFTFTETPPSVTLDQVNDVIENITGRRVGLFVQDRAAPAPDPVEPEPATELCGNPEYDFVFLSSVATLGQSAVHHGSTLFGVDCDSDSDSESDSDDGSAGSNLGHHVTSITNPPSPTLSGKGYSSSTDGDGPTTHWSETYYPGVTPAQHEANNHWFVAQLAILAEDGRLYTAVGTFDKQGQLVQDLVQDILGRCTSTAPVFVPPAMLEDMERYFGEGLSFPVTVNDIEYEPLSGVRTAYGYYKGGLVVRKLPGKKADHSYYHIKMMTSNNAEVQMEEQQLVRITDGKVMKFEGFGGVDLLKVTRGRPVETAELLSHLQYHIDRAKAKDSAEHAAAGPAPENMPVQVFIKNIDGVTLKFNVPLSTKVEELIVVVSKETNIPAAEVRLIYSGSQLVGGKTLTESGVSRDATLHLVLRLKGGGKFHSKKYSRQQLDDAKQDPAFLKCLCERLVDGTNHGDDDSIDRYASQWLTIQKVRAKKPVKMKVDHAKTFSYLEKHPELKLAATKAKARRPKAATKAKAVRRKAATKPKAAVKLEYSSPPPDSDSDVEILEHPKFGVYGTTSATATSETFPALPPPDVDGADALLAAFTMDISN